MHAPIQPWALELPRTHADIDAIHRVKKRLAVERALQSKLLRPRLDGINLAKLDDPEEWRRIPVLTKEQLRKLSTDEFYRDFCIAPISSSIEMWRSGGSTGKPLFYPRSAEDIKYNLGVAFRRMWPCIGARAGDVLHSAFPMGIHPVGQMTPRSAQMEGISTVWAGAGTTTPTQSQIELIRELKPTIFAAMPSYALHIANVAEAQGIDLASSSVKKILVSAETLTDAKRAKIERVWGAKVYNSLGMTEAAMAVVERDNVRGMIAWTDLFLFEVLDSATGKPVAEGEQGTLVITPLWGNTITPFLRWSTGDIVTMRSQKRTEDPFSVFPVLEHALRTEGFFKVRGVNLNHGDLEDFMFSQSAITDFRGHAEATDGNDLLRLQIEVQREANTATLVPALKAAFKAKFELTPEIDVLETGTLAREFEKSVKAPRFADFRK
ncbi:MAG: AMP-binding protein [Burkholderiales bacterium]